MVAHLLVVFIALICVVSVTTFYIFHSIVSALHPNNDDVDYTVRTTDLHASADDYEPLPYKAQELAIPSAPPLDNTNGMTYEYTPPPSYNEAVATKATAPVVSFGSNDLKWHHVFSAFNEQRMVATAQWNLPNKSRRQLKKRLQEVNDFINKQTHPVSAQVMYRFLKSFGALTHLVYTQFSPSNDKPKDVTWHSTDRDMFLNSFSLLMTKYVPKQPIADRVVPFGYDWFIFTGRITYAIINAHIALCTVDREVPSTRPYYTENTLVATRAVAKGLKNICKNFTESLGYERYSSNRVYISIAFLYASLLERACLSLANGSAGGMPDYLETLNEILSDPANRFDSFSTLVGEIGRSNIPQIERRSKRQQKGIPAGAERTEFTYDGIYDDRTFIAHRRLRMYSYIRSYCEQLLPVQSLLCDKLLDENKMSALLRAVEPMSDESGLFYFNLHSRMGTFKYRSGKALFAALGISRYRTAGIAGGGTAYGRVYVADRARILFVQSDAFTFHAIGQLSDLAYGEVEKANRDLMPAWLMGQRPLFRSEEDKLIDVPCSAHLEPCVIDSGKSKDFQLDPINKRNTTDYVPTEASSAVVSFEEQNIGAVYTYVCERNMDVRYSRCTVATPYYTFTTYFRITRDAREYEVFDGGNVQLSCYTGAVDSDSNGGMGGSDENEVISSQKYFDFKHCTVRVLVQAQDGKDYGGKSVTLARREPVVKRAKSKSKYASDELHNVSISLAPYGYNTDPQLPASITILYRPKDSKAAAIPSSLANRKIVPRVTASTERNLYRIQIDSRYVVYCDDVRRIVILLDLYERRLCVAPVCATIQDKVTEEHRVDLINKASQTLEKDGLGQMKYDSFCNERIYAYFEAA